jgi:signal transduction histidine kinase
MIEPNYIAKRSKQILDRQLYAIHCRTDRAFAVLAIVQWVAAILCAAIITPKTWVGAQSYTHNHVWMAIFIGFLLTSGPVVAVLHCPGASSTRYIVTVSQLLYSALFIHITGGRIETHFHVFGSLAFLAFYRDWRLFLPATLIVAVDHLGRGLYWPESVYGVYAATIWRTLEHASWVVFEDVFLIWGCLGAVRDLQLVAVTQAELEYANATVEMNVEIRTAELRDRTERLEAEVDHRAQLESQLGQAQKLEAIGQLAAGLAHEINTPMQFVCDNIEYLSDCSTKLFDVVDTFERNLVDNSPVSWDERRNQLNLVMAQNQFETIRQQVPLAITESLDGAQRVIQIVRAMKEFSHVGQGQKSGVDLNNAVHSTVTITRNRWKYAADLDLDLDPNLPTLICAPSEINQVLLNLIVNAADAVAERVGDNAREKGRITVRTRTGDGDIVIEVEDTGGGIPENIRSRIFDPFFTTKDVGKGTGQGLAICHNVVVNKHQGSIAVESTLGVGTTFRVHLPVVRHPEEVEPSAVPADEVCI